eukprot:489799-Karenia_brevis.AAC.1
MGPIGLLLQHTHYNAAAIDFHSWIMHTTCSTPFHFMHIPYQHLAKHAADVAIWARNCYAVSTRTSLTDGLIPDPD